MDIIVMGEASKKFKPEEITISLTFSIQDKEYNKALENGSKSIENFINNVLKKLDISKDELKTNRLNVSEINNYNSVTKKREFLGYAFNQYSHIKLDYDIKIMTQFMELVSKLDNPPSYIFNYNVKDIQKCKNIVLAQAYGKSKEKAEVIALAAGKKLIDCLKVDFKPFSEQLTSNTSLNNLDFKADSILRKEKGSVADTLEKTFTPEDVVIRETIYSLWKAE